MDYEENQRRRRGRISGCIGTILTVAYAVYIVNHFGNASMENAAGFIATALVMPHMICVALAAVFSLVGFFARKRWGMLTAAILMSVSAVVFPTYAMLVIVQAVLMFITYVSMKE